jgi:hypothetical protein
MATAWLLRIDSLLPLESTSSHPAAPRSASEKARETRPRDLVAGGVEK